MEMDKRKADRPPLHEIPLPPSAPRQLRDAAAQQNREAAVELLVSRDERVRAIDFYLARAFPEDSRPPRDAVPLKWGPLEKLLDEWWTDPFVIQDLHVPAWPWTTKADALEQQKRLWDERVRPRLVHRPRRGWRERPSRTALFACERYYKTPPKPYSEIAMDWRDSTAKWIRGERPTDADAIWRACHEWANLESRARTEAEDLGDADIQKQVSRWLATPLIADLG